MKSENDIFKDLSVDSNEVELPMSSLSKDDSIDSHIAEENEKMFRNGIYSIYTHRKNEAGKMRLTLFMEYRLLKKII